jgi:hypothetical protein
MTRIVFVRGDCRTVRGTTGPAAPHCPPTPRPGRPPARGLGRLLPRLVYTAARLECTLSRVICSHGAFAVRARRTCPALYVHLYVRGQNHGFARAIEISRSFRDPILVEASEMNNTVGFIFKSAPKRFLFKLVCFQHLNSMQSISSTF